MTITKATPEDFVRAWQTSDSIKSVMEITGLSYTSVSRRVSDYRKKGINLKKMKHGRSSIDVDALNKICQSTPEAKE